MEVEPLARERACRLAAYPSSAAFALTRWARDSLTPGVPDSAREAVAMETPAASATSIRRGRAVCGFIDVLSKIDGKGSAVMVATA